MRGGAPCLSITVGTGRTDRLLELRFLALPAEFCGVCWVGSAFAFPVAWTKDLNNGQDLPTVDISCVSQLCVVTTKIPKRNFIGRNKFFFLFSLQFWRLTVRDQAAPILMKPEDGGGIITCGTRKQRGKLGQTRLKLTIFAQELRPEDKPPRPVGLSWAHLLPPLLENVFTLNPSTTNMRLRGLNVCLS